jgi:2-dehydro-3-deoxy-D-arabinonate dehydratase
VLTAGVEVFGYTVCDDVSSRDIEGENPLYLPQAKVYAGSCALAYGIRPAWEVPDPMALGIEVRVTRDGGTVFQGSTSTASMRRTLPELIACMGAAQDYPEGAVLATGTGIVPDLDFTLAEGDVVDISVEQVGSLSNPVTSVEVARSRAVARLGD